MSDLSKKDLERFAALHALALQGATPGEREAARAKLEQWLERHDLSWGDVPELAALAAREALAAKEAAAAEQRRKSPEGPAPFTKKFSALDQARGLLEMYLDLREHEHVAVALWCLHTHVYDRFTHTPRLALMSPSNGCGKSTAFNVIAQLSARAEIIGNVTAAGLFRLTAGGNTLLLDEGDNLGLLSNPILRSVITSGHEPGRPIVRTINGETTRFEVFAPMALAAIGNFPVPIMKRAIVVHMRRPLPSVIAKLKKFTAATRLDHTWAAIVKWAERVKLDLDPPLPPGINSRVADNWRPLISIADSFSKEWGALARKSALAFQSTYTDEDIAILLLYDIRSILNRQSLDFISSEGLLLNLLAVEDSWTWSAYRGIGDDLAARKLTTGEISRLLRPFHITPKSIWAPGPRLPGDSSFKGYRRAWFEDAWSRYCPDPPDPQPSPPTQPQQVTELVKEPWE